MMSWPLKELFEAYDIGEQGCKPSRFYELLAHNDKLTRKQSKEWLLAMLTMFIPIPFKRSVVLVAN